MASQVLGMHRRLLQPANLAAAHLCPLPSLECPLTRNPSKHASHALSGDPHAKPTTHTIS